MRTRRSIRCLVVTAMFILTAATFTKSVMADPVTIVLGSLSGTVDPITYTTAAGTFTTGPITLSLNTSSTSFFVIDEDTGVITAHTVMNVVFDDGRGETLSGVLFVDEEGTVGPQPILMNITSGVLIGAGQFSGTRLRGINTTILRFFDIDAPNIDWEWGFPSPPRDDPPRPPIILALPTGFINGDNVLTSGKAHASAVPEPATLVLLGTGMAGIAGALSKRGKAKK